MFKLKTNIKILNFERRNKKELSITFETKKSEIIENNNDGVISLTETSEIIVKEGFYEKNKNGIISDSILYLLNQEQIDIINKIIVDTDKEIKIFYEQAIKGLEEFRVYMDSPILVISKSAFNSKYCYNYIMDMINYIVSKNVKWFNIDKNLDKQIMEEEGLFQRLTEYNKKFNDNGNIFIKLSLNELIVLLKRM